MLASVTGAMLMSGGTVQAQRWSTTTSIDSLLTVTDNANLDGRGQEKSDAIFEITPRIAFRRDGARLRVNGSAALTATTYVDGTRSSRLGPSLNLGAALEAIERFFFIDADVRVQQDLESPFGPTSTIGSGINRLTSTQARVSPYVTGSVGTRWRYQLRSDNSWIRQSGGLSDRRDQIAYRQLAELTLLPQPFGVSVSYDRNESDIEGGGRGRQTTEIARAIFSYGNERFSAGLRAGYEKNNFPGFNSEHVLYGANLSWRPSERTNLSVFGEKRFFGTGWQAVFDHRRPRLAFTVRSSRDVSTLPQRFLALPVTLDVAALIEASLITRIPDPIERARAVEDLIVSRGLPRSLIAPVDIYTERVELRSAHSATAVLIGARNSASLTLFSTKTEGITSSGSGVTLPAALLDNTQRGAGLGLSHQLSQRTSLNAEASWRDTQGLGASSDDSSRQQTYTVRFTQRLAPNTTATAGARYQLFDSTLQADTTETAIFVGLSHRF